MEVFEQSARNIFEGKGISPVAVSDTNSRTSFLDRTCAFASGILRYSVQAPEYLNWTINLGLENVFPNTSTTSCRIAWFRRSVRSRKCDPVQIHSTA